jgi:hypothetical protein
MMDEFKGKAGFWRGVFSESDGTPSFARVGTGVIVGFACFWVTYLVMKNHGFPEFAGVSSFVTVLYGANVLKSIADSFANKDKAPDQPKS